MRRIIRRAACSFLSLAMLLSGITSGSDPFMLHAAAEEEQPQYGYFAVSNGNYAQLPEKVTYLGSEAAPIVDYDNGGKKFATKVNEAYDGGEILLLDAKSAYTGEGASAAWTGGTAFAKGLGVHPCNGREGYTDINLTGLQVDTFYSAVGITNKKTMYNVQFSVYAKVNEEDEWKTLMDYTTVKKGTSGEIRLDISGYTYLRLAVKQVEKYQSLGSAWANACVYHTHKLIHVEAKESTPEQAGNIEHWHCEKCGKYYSDANAENEITASDVVIPRTGYIPSADGSYQGFSAVTSYLSDLPDQDNVKEDANLEQKIWSYVTPASGKKEPRTAKKDTNWSGKAIALGEKQQTFEKGLSAVPSDPGKDQNYIRVDISDLTGERFYSVVGINGSAANPGGANYGKYGVVFSIYGSTEKTDSTDVNDYTLLAVSDKIYQRESGEFNVDVEGCKTLLLVGACSDAHNYGCDFSWADACVYHTHKLTHVEAKEATSKQEGNIEYWYCEPCGKYFADAEARTELAASDVIIPKRSYTASTDGSYKGFEAVPVYLSDLTVSSFVTPGADKVPRTVKKDVDWDGKTIVLGEKQQSFLKGLSGLPSMPGKDPNYIRVDIKDQEVDRFYSVVGINGSAANPQSANYGKYGVVFTVYGSKETTESTNVEDYTLLESSDTVMKRESGEFNVDITGYKTLLLVGVCSSTANYGCNFSWGDACVYNSKEVHKHELTEVPEKAATIGADGNIRYWICQGCGKWFYDAEGTTEITDKKSVTIPRLDAQATDNYIPNTDGIFARMPGDATYLSALDIASYVTPGSDKKPRTAKKDTNWQNGTIVLGQMQSSFVKGLSVLPSVSGKENNYILADISGRNVNRFYAAVGITGSAATPKHANYGKYGVIFYVYGSTEKTDSTNAADYTLLACSGKIYRRESGQFNVDIAGMQTLLLVVETTDKNNYGCDSAWGNVCVYSGTGELTTSFDAKAYHDNNGVSRGINPREGSVIWLSDLTYLEAKNNNSDKKPTVPDHPYGAPSNKIILGEKDNRYIKGLGVHPSGYTVYDVSSQDRDTFYASVGITNDKGKKGASAGVIFKVYGDYGDGNYQLLSQSSVITGKMTGEFWVKIRGVKKLRLSVEPNGKVDSSGSAWAAACLYNADPGASYSTELTEVGPAVKLLEPTAGFTVVTSGFTKMNKDVVYLSDLPYTSYVTPAKDGIDRKVKRDVSWENKPIVLGPTQANFSKGFGTLPSVETKDDNYILVDISGQNRERFFSAVGMTGSAATVDHENYGKYGVIFLVYGSKEKLTSTNPKDYTLLASSGAIYQQTVGQFDLDVTGYQTLLLITDTAGELNYGCSSVWGNACLYTPTGLTEPDKGKYFQKDAYVANVGGFQGMRNSRDDVLSYLSDMKFLQSSNLVTEAFPKGEPTTINKAYGSTSGTGFVLSDKDTRFDKGLGMMGKERNTPVDGSVESFTIYDLSATKSTSFYAAVGLTNAQARSSAEVVFRVYGDYKGRGEYHLLAQSETISGSKTGEFQVDTTDVKVLKLVVVSTGESNVGSESAWADVCVYGRAGGENEKDASAGGGFRLWYLLIPVGVLVIAAAVTVPLVIRKKRKTKSEGK